MSYKVLDVSTWQGLINYDKVKADGIQAIIPRAGYGKLSSQQDNQYINNMTNADKAGLPLGSYWYSYALNLDDADLEASVCYDIIKQFSTVKFIAFDIEDKSMIGNGKQSNTDIANRFLDFFKAKGYKTLVYVNPNWMRNYIDVEQIKAHGHKVWMAAYSNKTPNDTDYSADCSMWQWASDYHVDGINANVDVNICYDESLFGDSVVTPQPIAPTPVSTPAPKPVPVVNNHVDVTYRVKTKNKGWLPEVTNLNDFAGIENDPIVCIAIKASQGSVKYRVHYKDGNRWSSSYVTGYNTNDFNNGFAGNGNDRVDALDLYYYTPDSIRPYKKAKYCVSPIESTTYYSWQYDETEDGYAGIFGHAIDKLQIVIE